MDQTELIRTGGFCREYILNNIFFIVFCIYVSYGHVCLFEPNKQELFCILSQFSCVLLHVCTVGLYKSSLNGSRTNSCIFITILNKTRHVSFSFSLHGIRAGQSFYSFPFPPLIFDHLSFKINAFTPRSGLYAKQISLLIAR